MDPRGDAAVVATVPSPPAVPDHLERPRSVAILEPQPGGAAVRLADRIGPDHPVRVWLVVILGGYALLVALTISVGLLLTELLVPIHGFEKWDNDINRWLAERRSPTLDDLSWVGSTLAGGIVIPAVVGVLVVVFLVRRKWLLAAFTLFAIGVESGAYRATTVVVHRDRPPVDRMESLPVEASYPSGHIAASIALFGGLLLLLASRLERRWFSVVAFAVAAAIVLFVGWARMYRGMHHLTDSAAGVIMVLLALVITVFAARAATAASNRRDSARGEGS